MGENRPPYQALRSENIMESGDKQRTHMGTRTVYQIVVRGEAPEVEQEVVSLYAHARNNGMKAAAAVLGVVSLLALFR